MSAIITTYVIDCKLSKDISNKELSQHIPELLKLLIDRTKGDKGHRCLKDGYSFSKEQISILVPSQRTGRAKIQVTSQEEESEAEVNIYQISDIIPEGETIKEMAQRIIRDNFSKKEVEAIRRTLVKIATDAVVGSSRISRARRELRNLNALEEITSAMFDRETTCASNKIQKARSDQCENEGIDFPDHFSLESVKERLDLYDVSNIPNKQALADVMIMLCIRPSEIKNLRISNGGVTGYAKNRGQQDIPRVFRSLETNEERARELLTWIQEAISSRKLGDPGSPGVKFLNKFLKKDEFIPETESHEPLLSSSLRKLGSVFMSEVHSPKNPSKANTYASEALRHSPDNHSSPSKRYTIVNMHKRGKPYYQVKVFKLFDES
jgi:hypothetical protein